MSETKSITEQLEEVKDKICTEYCKYPSVWDTDKEGKELWKTEHCDNCPLNRL